MVMSCYSLMPSSMADGFSSDLSSLFGGKINIWELDVICLPPTSFRPSSLRPMCTIIFSSFRGLLHWLSAGKSPSWVQY